MMNDFVLKAASSFTNLIGRSLNGENLSQLGGEALEKTLGLGAEIIEMQTLNSWDPSFKKWYNFFGNEKKRILVLTNGGGGGHLASAEAVKKALGEFFKVKIDHSFDEMGGNELFNTFQKGGHLGMLEVLTYLQPIAEITAAPIQVRPVLIDQIEKFKPDLIISVFPIANRMTWEIAKEAGIPMFVLTTDIEARHFFRGIENPGKDFHIGLPFSDRLITGPLSGQFDEENFEIIGYPLREAFGKKTKDMQEKIDEIRLELGIAEEDKVVLIMMGAQGVGTAVEDYSKAIANHKNSFKEKVHVIALCGGEEKKESTIKACDGHTNPNVTVHALGRKDGEYIAALMRMGNLLISKPGGSTVNEAIASKIYTLFNGEANKALPWEAGNMAYAVAKGFGEEIDPEKFLEQVEMALDRERPSSIQCPGKRFGINLMNAVCRIFEERNPQVEKRDPSSLKKFAQRFEKIMEGNGSLFDKLIILLSKREAIEAIKNILSDEDVETLKAVIFNSENVDDALPEVKEIFQKILSKEDIFSELINKIFPSEGKAFSKRWENFIVRFIVKLKGKEIVKDYHAHISKAILELLKEETLSQLIG